MVLASLLTVAMILYNNHVLPESNHRLLNLLIDYLFVRRFGLIAAGLGTFAAYFPPSAALRAASAGAPASVLLSKCPFV